MNLAATVALRKPLQPQIPRVWAYGTSEGVTKAWDTRGRGRKFTLPNGRSFELKGTNAQQDEQLAWIRKEELAKLPPEVQQAFSKGVDTQGIFSKDGKYSDEREAVHAEIVGSYLEGHKPQANPRLEVIAGGTASGKGGIAKEVQGRMQDYVYANSDNIRAMLPEIGAFVGNDKQGLLQEEAGYVRDQLLAAASKAGMNIVLDAPGSHSIVNFASEAEKQGYTVAVNYVHRDPQSAAESALGRKYTADHISDVRDVPNWVTYGSHTKARSAIGALSKGREFTVYDNQQGFNKPPVYQRSADGKVKVYNEERLGVIAHGQSNEFPEISDSTFSR
jgi:predicted ABC-type ATPase